MSGLGFNPRGGNLGFRKEFGGLGANPFPDAAPKIAAGPGIFVTHLGDGRVAISVRRTRGGAGAGPEPFDVTVSGIADPRDVTVRPGTVNNLLPTNMFTIGATPVSGTRYVTLDLTFANGECTLAQLSMDLAAPGATPVTIAAPPTSFKILIALIVDTVVFQIRNGNITCTPAEAFRADKAAPAAPGELVYDSYWQWNVSP